VAEAAGLRGLLKDGARTGRPGDVILELDGKQVTDRRSLVAALSTIDVAAPVTIRIWREGEILEIKARFPPTTRPRTD